MEIKDFVDSLPLESFEALRVAVVRRQTIQAEQMAAALEYMVSQPALIKAAKVNKAACIRVLSEKTGISPELTNRVVDQYLEMEASQTGNPLVPFKVTEINNTKEE